MLSRLRIPALLCLLAISATVRGSAETADFHPKWLKNAALYEVNVRQFSEEGTFDAVTAELPRIRDLGIDILWLMPIHPIGEKNRKGPLGSYYAVKDYRAINPEFGDRESFARLVDRAHELGMKVILDWVANHTAWDHPWTETNPDYYVRVDGEFVPPVEDWSDVIELDYDNPELREAMIDAMVHWVEEFGIDGFRCDVAEEVPVDFWEDARAELNEHGEIVMLAEGQLPAFHDSAFEMTYAWHQMGEMRKLVAGEITAADLAAYEEYEQEEKYPASAIRLKFLTNHDENSWHATVEEDYGPAAGVLRAYTVASRGMPLIYNGEEAGLDKQLEFFEKDPIEWRPHPEGRRIARLLAWKERNQALWNGVHGGEVVTLPTGADDQVWAFTRAKGPDRIVALLNLSPEPASFAIDEPTVDGRYRDVMTGDLRRLDGKDSFRLPAWGYLLLERTGRPTDR